MRVDPIILSGPKTYTHRSSTAVNTYQIGDDAYRYLGFFAAPLGIPMELLADDRVPLFDELLQLSPLYPRRTVRVTVCAPSNIVYSDRVTHNLLRLSCRTDVAAAAKIRRRLTAQLVGATYPYQDD